MYQHYISSRLTTKMITEIGDRLIFVNYEFITKTQKHIDYLDAEIEAGLPGITKCELKPLVDPDPMKNLREKHFKEFEAQQAQQVRSKSSHGDSMHQRSVSPLAVSCHVRVSRPSLPPLQRPRASRLMPLTAPKKMRPRAVENSTLANR